jgi:hypothetical protein
MTDTVTQAAPETPGEPLPWDDVVPTPLYTTVHFVVDRTTLVSLSEFRSDAGNATGVNVVIADASTTVNLSLGIGWANEERVIEIADRLIEVLQQARENASERIEKAAHVHDFRQADEAQFCATCGQERR